MKRDDTLFQRNIANFVFVSQIIYRWHLEEETENCWVRRCEINKIKNYDLWETVWSESGNVDSSAPASPPPLHVQSGPLVKVMAVSMRHVQSPSVVHLRTDNIFAVAKEHVI